MLVSDFEIIITKTFPAALMLSPPFGFYGDILELVYTTPSCGAMVSARISCLSSLPSILCCLHAFPTSKHGAVYETVCQMALFTMLFFYLNFFPRLIIYFFKRESVYQY